MEHTEHVIIQCFPHSFPNPEPSLKFGEGAELSSTSTWLKFEEGAETIEITPT
jgi:hypothetical protein